MYAGVPICIPTWVSTSPATVVAALSARATPKSATIATPSANRTFSGLMSRWTIPWRCAYPIAQRRALDERHRVVRNPIDVTGGQQRNDVRMLQTCGESDLTLETFGRDARDQVG